MSNQQIWVEYSTLENYCDPLYLWVINVLVRAFTSEDEAVVVAADEGDVVNVDDGGVTDGGDDADEDDDDASDASAGDAASDISG